MTTLTLPNLDQSFFNIEGPKDVLPPLPDNLKLPPIIDEYDGLLNDIHKYTNNNSLPSNLDNPDCTIQSTTTYPNAGLAAIAKQRQYEKQKKDKRVNRFKTNNPMTKQKGQRCPWPELPVRESIESYVVCCWYLCLLDIFMSVHSKEQEQQRGEYFICST